MRVCSQVTGTPCLIIVISIVTSLDHLPQVSTDPKTKSVEVVKASLQRWPRGSSAPAALAAAAAAGGESKDGDDASDDDGEDSWTGPVSKDETGESSVDDVSDAVASTIAAEPEKPKEREKRAKKERKQLRKEPRGTNAATDSHEDIGAVFVPTNTATPASESSVMSTDDHAHTE
jgi:hypothetical protein